jgi:hypothetical protein
MSDPDVIVAAIEVANPPGYGRDYALAAYAALRKQRDNAHSEAEALADALEAIMTIREDKAGDVAFYALTEYRARHPKETP